MCNYRTFTHLLGYLFVRQERQELENRLDLIDSKQRQLEAQDRLITEALTFSPRSLAEPVTDGVKDSHISDEALRHMLHVRSGSEDHHGAHLSRDVTDHDVTSSEHASLLPSSNYISSGTLQSAVPLHNAASIEESDLPFVPHSGRISADSKVDSHVERIREYQDELLTRQTDRPRALLEARRRLQMRAEQLLNSGLNLVPESRSNTLGSLSHTQLVTVPSDKSDLCEVDSYRASHLSTDDRSQVKSSDVLRTEIAVTKPYKPELYRPRSEGVEPFEYNAAVAVPDDGDDADDERQFVTPELREDGRVRPCRVAEYSPSPSPHTSDAAYRNKSLQLSTSSSHSYIQMNKDDFSSLVLQAQRDLEVRQQQMQEQLEALESEEQRLAKQQLRISSQLGSFPSEIETLAHTTGTDCQQPATVLDPYRSSSSDVLAVVLPSSVSAQNIPNISRNNTRHRLPASTNSVDVSGLRLDRNDQMTADNESSQAESRQIHLSHSAPLLQNQDGSLVYGASDQLMHSWQSPVSIPFGHCLKTHQMSLYII